MLQELRRRRPSRAAVPPTPSSARDDLEFSATVQSPRFFSTSLDCWALFTQSHDLDAVFTDSERREIALCFSRPAKSKCKVVLIRAALVSMARDSDAHVRMAKQHRCLCFESRS